MARFALHLYGQGIYWMVTLSNYKKKKSLTSVTGVYKGVYDT